jgi:MoaA/NifB/PqqE/SkfB family radical SAM enzyme
LGTQKKICYAPFKSLYFGVDGIASACCLNQSHVLGKIPFHSITDIWNGEKIQELRTSLSNNDLSKGCFECKNRIESGNYDAVEAAKYDVFPWKNKYPIMLEFELSNQCNLQCIMCSSKFSSSIHRSESELPVRQNFYDDNFFRQLDEYIPHLVKAKFLGGEPFVIPVYYRIWDRILELNPKCIILVQTNATILNEKIKAYLNKGNFRIGISLESFRKDTYELIRKNADYEKVMENISYFADYAHRKKYPFWLAICPMQQNWKELPEIISRSNELKAHVFFNTVLNPYDCSLNSLPYADLKNVVEQLSSFKLPVRNIIEKKNKLHFECFLSQLKTWLSEKEKKENIRQLWLQNQAEIETKSTEELCKLIIEKIKKANPDICRAEDNETRFNNSYLKLKQIVSPFENNPHLKNILFNLMQIPQEFLFYELEKREIDYLQTKVSNMLDEIHNENQITNISTKV